MELLIAHFILVVLLSRTTITGKEWSRLLTSLEFNYLETAKKILSFPQDKTNSFKKTIDNAPVRRFAIAMNKNSAFTGSLTEKPFSYQQVDLRQIRILEGGQPILDFDAVDNCSLYVTIMKAIKFQHEIPSIPIDNFKDHYVLVIN